MKFVSVLLLCCLLTPVAHAQFVSLQPQSITVTVPVPQYRPIIAQPQSGVWMLYHRPCWLGDAIFGPVWVWIPTTPQSATPAQNPGIPPLTPQK